MAAWHRSRRADMGLRAAGVLLCCLSYAAFARLMAMRTPPQTADAVAYLLAAIGFTAASIGSAMLLLGNHLFDKVEVSARWHPQSTPVLLFPARDSNIMKSAEPRMLVVGRDVDDSWTVRESAGLLLGRFASAQAAQRFAEAERRATPATSIANSAGSPHRLTGRLSLSSWRSNRLEEDHG